jgi:pimeloyl-[acyl-carrier protein] methyl ester esterase
VGLALLERCDLRERLRALVPPSLWLFGERDTLVPAAAAADILGLCPSAQVQVIQGAAHAPFLSHPARSGELMASFVRGVPR